ncbi:MFS transporter [Thalassomonas actiniarum]|uniref:MFS transporter n=1 Tax=Thalassomonas actiniarum TaxID=485447 RepID=A0AAE9YT10_9GAMM|nr:MFS transporter [Thalassomonas actiniarum]WDD99768.1 MFS transporter [Thalassomonas actiniarum]
MKQSAYQLKLLLFCQFLATFGLMVLIPVMPLYLTKLTASNSSATLWASFALAAPAIGSLLTAPLIGRLADSWGHRRVLFLSLSAFGCSLLMMSYASSMMVFIAARVLLGFSGISVAITSYTMHTVSASARGQALGKQQSAVAAACLSGPLLGGIFMDKWGMELLLNLTAALTCITLLVAALLLRHVPEHAVSGSRQPLPSKWYLRRDNLAWLGAGILAQAGAFSLVTCFALYISEQQSLALPVATTTGMLHALAWTGTFLAGAYWGKRNDLGKAGINFILASAVCGIAIGLLIWADVLWQFALLRLLQGLCFAALIPSVMYSLCQSCPDHPGQVTGTAKSALVLGQLAGPLAVAAIYPFWGANGALLMTAGLFIGGSLLLIINKYLALALKPQASGSKTQLSKVIE